MSFFKQLMVLALAVGLASCATPYKPFKSSSGTGSGSGSGSGAVPTGSGTIGGVPYAGQGTNTANGNVIAAAAAVGAAAGTVAPGAYPGTTLPTNYNPTNAAMRIQYATDLMTECAINVANLGPQPGETLMGLWTWTCDDGSGVAATTVFGTYPNQWAGFGVGNGSFFISGVSSTGEVGVGPLTVDPQTGDASAYYTSTYGIYLGYLYNSQPDAGWGVGSGGEGPGCGTVAGVLTTSANPDPAKHTEAMKELGWCYRQAIIFISPILYDYVYNLNAASAQQILASLGLY